MTVEPNVDLCPHLVPWGECRKAHRGDRCPCRVVDGCGCDGSLIENCPCYSSLLTVGHSEDATDSGAALISAERRRQIEVEGWTEKHDDEHISGELAAAGAAYALAWPDYDPRPDEWPWTAREFKPTGDRVRDLVKAGALICAEIDRLQRARRTARTGGAR